MSEASKPTKTPVSRERRWVVVGRRPGATAYFLGPYSFDRAVAEAEWTQRDRPDAAVAIYELDKAAGWPARGL